MCVCVYNITSLGVVSVTPYSCFTPSSLLHIIFNPGHLHMLLHINIELTPTLLLLYSCFTHVGIYDALVITFSGLVETV